MRGRTARFNAMTSLSRGTTGRILVVVTVAYLMDALLVRSIEWLSPVSSLLLAILVLCNCGMNQ